MKICTKDIWQGSLGWLEQGFYLLEYLERKGRIRDKVILKVALDHRNIRLLLSVFASFYTGGVLTQGDVCDDTAKYERCQKRQRNDEAVEKAVIAFAHTVPHPRAVVIKSF